MRYRNVFLGAPAIEEIREIPLVASVLYYSLTIFFARLLRSAIRRTLPQPYQDLAGNFAFRQVSRFKSWKDSVSRHKTSGLNWRTLILDNVFWPLLSDFRIVISSSYIHKCNVDRRCFSWKVIIGNRQCLACISWALRCFRLKTEQWLCTNWNRLKMFWRM